jgi:phosphoribosylaminoimidazole-succinocarboxamide synthase
VDTKYEFGAVGDALYVIDEMHTPDSSRFWRASSYEERWPRAPTR